MQRSAFLILSFLSVYAFCWPYDEPLAKYNLNENKTAAGPIDYWGAWPDHEYHPSPDNWRLPTYTIFLDRISNGDPTNDDINGTAFEHVINSNQMRHGGDLEGLIDTLDYIEGMGFKVIYFAGTYLMNLPWAYDGYSPVDTTLLDMHYGTVEDWRRAIDEIHKRNMYVLVDNTLATMSNLIGFKGHLNDSADFTPSEYEVQWVTDREYADFKFGNEWNETCNYPKFWDETGFPLTNEGVEELKGCYNSDFDQFGELEAFGNFPDWQRQLTKFASVQDRLREWHKPVRDVITQHSCLQIASLDIDGFRFDKSVQSTLEPLSQMLPVYRACAQKLGKKNFFLPGEITSGDSFGSLYLGRGRQPDQRVANAGEGVRLTNTSEGAFLREDGLQALDGSAFHYTIYRSMTRFLGLDGNLVAGFDLPTDFIEAWNEMLVTNDFLNAFTGEIDPRHMYGVSNQDNFRWPALQNGTDKYLLGLYIISLELPGIPLILWGEEQDMYVFDATAANYMFGRQPMTYQTAWWTQGCFNLNTEKFYDFPIDKGRNGCNDITVTYDQRNPAHPLRNIMKRMFEIRAHFPVAQDGLFLETISQLTEDIYLPGSSTTPTVTGLWSVLRSYFPGVQTNAILANETLWLVYQNGNSTKTYGGNCTSANGSLLAPFDSGTKLKNLFYPYDELTLEDGPKSSKNTYGCVRKMELLPWEYRAYVKASEFIEPGPTVTDFFPGHDARLLSSEDTGETMPIQLGYSTEMDCDSITKAVYLNSTTEKNITAELDKSSVNCTKISARTTSHAYTGEIPTVWTWSAKLKNVHHGIHQLTVKNVSSSGVYTNSTDKFLLRLGAHDNPLISPLANYSSTLVHKSNDNLYLQHKAAGADMFRYSSDFGRSWNDWATYKGGNTSITIPSFTGTDSQKWEGTHIRVQYFSRLTGSSDYIQEGDYGSDTVRRFPHLWFNGPYNQYGYDAGMDSKMKYDSKTSRWTYDFVYEWPAIGQLNVWGSDSEGNPDTSEVYGDVGNSSSVQKLPPSYLSSNVINITTLPPFPHLGWTISLDDGNLRYELIPVGSGWAQLVLFILLWVVPILMGLAGVFIFIGNFYRVKLNMNGNVTKADKFPVLFWRRIKGTFSKDDDFEEIDMADKGVPGNMALAAAGASDQRRTVLIATMEYDIQDWKVKVKIGGLGVMAQLMSQNLKHQNLIWVVPCVGDIDYPEDTPAEPFVVTILDHPYSVQVQYHQVDNITYVLLDAPVFRQQTKAEPYPPRMDDLDSAIYYSAWNQCIAEVIKRTPSIDLYHINDFHGCVAPLYLLPSRTIPVCLSLHNAEFQGLWALRTPQEKKEVCSVFNIPVEIATKYCQFGNVFNLLHTGASYLRFHQRGFGAVGVSEKYGKRSWARYPIFWSLAKIGSLPNPDPSDTAALKKDPDVEVSVQTADESANDKLQAQKWAGLNEDPNADLLVFVGRWSKQKGVDLIADVMPAVLSARPNVQLICIGPLIDLYGKLAAIKLERIMEMFPGRVFSKPEFTILPPFVFSGADFALIPSRDEPFGLIAVEFGRKGALGIGSRIGGLGQMPGWWYTVESDSARHLLHQLRTAIKSALDSSLETRQEMRANSAKQRFPVLEWVQKLEVLQRTSIHIHHQKNQLTVAGSARESQIYWETPGLRDSGMITRPSSHLSLPGTLDANRTSTSQPPQPSLLQLQAVEAQEMQAAENNRGSTLNRNLSLGRRSGPGHGRKRLTKKSPRESQMLEPIDGDTTDDESFVTPQENMITQEEAIAAVNLPLQDIATHPRNNSHSRGESDSSASESSRFLSRDSSPVRVARDLSDPTAPYALESRNISVLSLPSVVNDHDQPNFHLQKVDPTFTDSMGHFTRNFETMLANLNKKNSISDYCIELYLMKSERKFFYMYNDAQLKKQPKERPATGAGLDQTVENTPYNLVTEGHEDSDANNTDEIDQWLARLGYKRPIAVQRFMRWRVGNWPVYALFLGLGQIIATNSAQITLLAGQIGETAVKLYVIAAIYCVSSIAWWCLFFRFPSVIVLTLPWFIYSMAFVTMGVSPFALSEVGQAWAQNVAAGVYAAASSSGSLFFALNFGDQGAVPVKDWMFRASLIQGISQLYTVALWYWSSKVTAAEVGGVSTVALNSWKLTAVVMPIAAVCFIIGVLLALGLPKYYRQAPGKILFFYTSLFRRRIVLWFFFMVIIQNWFLSAAFGRNWSFLWSSQHTKPWEVALLVIFFFVVLWVGVMLLFRFLSKEHSWILPVFGLSIGAPRWAQTWWGTSNIGYYLPWAGGLTSGAIASRCLWLWLGVLDEIQQVGLGMILLQTLTRVHVVFVLLAAQALGSIATICARGFAPNKVGPGDISPAIGSSLDAVGNAWFWIALFFQLLASFGFLLFYRREQLNRP